MLAHPARYDLSATKRRRFMGQFVECGGSCPPALHYPTRGVKLRGPTDYTTLTFSQLVYP